MASRVTPRAGFDPGTLGVKGQTLQAVAFARGVRLRKNSAQKRALYDELREWSRGAVPLPSADSCGDLLVMFHEIAELAQKPRARRLSETG